MIYSKFITGAICSALLIGCSHIKPVNNDNKQLPPKLTKPIARRIWIEPQITENGSIYVEGHWKYIIQKESTWTK